MESGGRSGTGLSKRVPRDRDRFAKNRFSGTRPARFNAYAWLNQAGSHFALDQKATAIDENAHIVRIPCKPQVFSLGILTVGVCKEVLGAYSFPDRVD